ncbi:MAG: transcription termination/antitermination protein NusG [Chlamydiales bacterium]
MSKWYVLQVLSGKERKTKEAIEENASHHGVQDLIEEVLLPTENVSEVRNGVSRVVEKKLWPGYLLIKMQLSDESLTYIIRTNGVVGFLGGSGSPTDLTEAEVNEILADLKAKKDTVVQKHQFSVGDTVKIIDGVFVNFIGTVTDVMPEKGKLSVVVSIFGRDTRVDDLEFAQVEEANDELEGD